MYIDIKPYHTTTYRKIKYVKVQYSTQRGQMTT